MPISPIRVCIADDHEMVRTVLASFLNSFPELAVVGAAADGCEALNICSQANPDVLITDLNMPGMDGITLTRCILQAHARIKVIVITSSLDGDKQREAIQAGAARCIQKDNTYGSLPGMIRELCARSAFGP